jgi:uncharacterized protein
MNRYLAPSIHRDLQKKLVLLTGPRQVGKTTLSRNLQTEFPDSLYLNYDIPADRRDIIKQNWPLSAPLLVFDEIHKMPNWKAWLKGVFDGRSKVAGVNQQILVTGSARMETFRQAGPSLAGRYFAWRLHPISVREWCSHSQQSAEKALSHLLERGGFPEPTLAPSNEEAERWRIDYFSGLIREDVVDFSRVHELNAMRLFANTLRQRVGSPLSIASIARDMGVAPKTLTRYLDILEALFIVFTVRPWSRNIARATLLQPKVYFFDTGLVQGDNGLRFENLVACHLLKHAQWRKDALGKEVELHYLRTKDGKEVDFALSASGGIEPHLTHLIECKWSDKNPHAALSQFREGQPNAEAIQLVRELRTERDVGGIQIRKAAGWLQELDA